MELWCIKSYEFLLAMGIVLERRMHSKEEMNDGKRFLATIAGGKHFLQQLLLLKLRDGLWCNKSYKFPFAVGVVSEKGIWYILKCLKALEANGGGGRRCIGYLI